MESRLKERLTGAAILVALIVLLVPEMFHGQRGDVAATASSGEGPPVRSYTIDLSNGPARTAPLQSTPSTPALAAPTDNNAESTPTPALTPAPSQTPATPMAAPVPSSSGAVKAPPPAAATSAASTHTAAGAWSVQLGIFASHDNAERLMHSAQVKGFAVSVSERDAKGLYHVQAGNLSDHAAAQAMQGRLHDQGFAAALVPPSPATPRTQPH